MEQKLRLWVKALLKKAFGLNVYEEKRSKGLKAWRLSMVYQGCKETAPLGW